MTHCSHFRRAGNDLSPAMSWAAQALLPFPSFPAPSQPPELATWLYILVMPQSPTFSTKATVLGPSKETQCSDKVFPSKMVPEIRLFRYLGPSLPGLFCDQGDPPSVSLTHIYVAGLLIGPQPSWKMVLVQCCGPNKYCMPTRFNIGSFYIVYETSALYTSWVFQIISFDKFSFTYFYYFQ